MDEDTYISVLLDEYIDLIELKEFVLILRDHGVHEWEGFADALDEFLEDGEKGTAETYFPDT